MPGVTTKARCLLCPPFSTPVRTPVHRPFLGGLVHPDAINEIDVDSSDGHILLLVTDIADNPESLDAHCFLVYHCQMFNEAAMKALQTLELRVFVRAVVSLLHNDRTSSKVAASMYTLWCNLL